MRKLLVVSESDLPETVTEALLASQWAMVYARTLESAKALADDHDVLVGLVVFPESRDTRHETYLQQQVATLSSLKWIAAMSEEQLRQREIKHFIADCLYDFHVFPLAADRIATVLGHAYGMARVERELTPRRSAGTGHRFGLIGSSPVMRTLYRMLQRAAESDVSVLITGPTGTGKELAARAIHDYSERSKGPYVAINCAAIPPSLLQSELFGHEKGSFTSATGKKIGYIQSAAGGTLFLDEIGDMPLESQATLLRFLEDKIVTPIGSTRGKHIDVRILASTNVDLEHAIREKRFRADLYYRLAFLTIQTPPLCQRGDDIEHLANHFLEAATIEAGMRSLTIAPEAIATLRRYPWPGNVRELRSAIFQAALGCDGLSIRPGDLKILKLPPELAHTQAVDADLIAQAAVSSPAVPAHHPMGTLKSAREQSEKRNLEFALERNACNITRTAQDLGVSRMTLYRLMAKHGVERNALGSGS